MIGAGGSGPQSADVDQVLTMQYPKGRAWLLKLGAPARARISLVKFYAAIGQCEGTVRYDIPGLFEYAAGLKAKMAGKPTRLFCSAYAAFLDECDGVLDPPGESLDPREESPQALADLPLYGSCTQIWGTPLAIHWGLAA